MNAVSEFIVDSHYSNDQIRFSLRIENLGGVRPSVDENGSLRHIAIMTSTERGRHNRTDNPYHDRIEGDVLVYTASGRKGDQSLSGRNKRIIEQYTSPIPIFGFINRGQQVYEFLGLLEVLRNYTEQQVDESGALRLVWVFEFRIHREPKVVPLANAPTLVAEILTRRSQLNVPLQAEREVVSFQNEPDAGSEQQTIKTEELRAKLLEINPYKFEHLIKAVVEQRGFIEVQVTRSSGDGGIDLNAVVEDANDFFGGTFVQFQAKRWRHAVGSVEINNFRGAMHSSAKGIFVTTSYYTRAATEDARNPLKSRITLIDGKRFAKILLESGISIAKYMESR